MLTIVCFFLRFNNLQFKGIEHEALRMFFPVNVSELLGIGNQTNETKATVAKKQHQNCTFCRLSNNNNIRFFIYLFYSVYPRIYKQHSDILLENGRLVA